MGAISRYLTFLTVFFSLAMLFRVELFGFTVSFYQITGVLLIIPVVLDNYKHGLRLTISALEFVTLVSIFVGLSLMSVLFSVHYTGNTSSQYLKNAVTLIGNFVIILTLVLYIARSEKNKNFFLKSFNITMKILMVYGIVQMLFFIPKFDLNSYIVDTFHFDVPYSSNLLGRFLRVSSLMWDTNFFGFQLLLYLMLYFKYKENSPIFKNDGFFSLLALILLVFTFSRSIYLGLIIFTLLNFRFRMSARLAQLILVILTSLVGILIYVYVRFKDVLEPIILTRFGFLFDSKYTTASTTARSDYWQIGMDILKKHPFGIGLGNYSEFAQVHFGDSFNKLHSSFLQIAVETGIFTSIFHYLLLYYFIVKRDNLSLLQYRISIFVSIVIISLFYDQTVYLFTYFFLMFNIDTAISSKKSAI